MQILKNLAYTFTAAFGISRVGKTVTVSVLDSSGNTLNSGFTAGSVIELSDGTYAVEITFTTNFSGFLKWTDTDDGLDVYDTVQVISDYTVDITSIRKIETNRWKILSNQLTIYDDDGTTPLFLFNLNSNGSPDGNTPDERVPV